MTSCKYCYSTATHECNESFFFKEESFQKLTFWSSAALKVDSLSLSLSCDTLFKRIQTLRYDFKISRTKQVNYATGKGLHFLN